MSRKPTPPGAPALPPIHAIRGRRVVLDSDLAGLYGVPTKRLNEAVRRNADRFPDDFCFQLTAEEEAGLRSQIATSNRQNAPRGWIGANRSQSATRSAGGRGGRRYRPWVFTEHGALMAGNVLNSPRAVQMSLFIVRAFVRMREELLTNAVVLKRLAQIDRKLLEHDVVLQDVIEKLLPLLNPPAEEKPRRRIGFFSGEV
jgi:ORF6N domain